MAFDDQDDAPSPPDLDWPTLTETQQRSLRAAGHLVRRLAAAAERDGSSPTSPRSAGRVSALLGGLVEAVTELAVHSVRALAAMPGNRAGAARSHDRPPTSGLAGLATGSGTGSGAPPTPDVARLVTGGPEAGPATIWLHNTTAEEQRDLRLFCGDLINHDGHRLRGPIVFTPAVIERLAAAGSQAITVTVEPAVPAEAPGTYRGTILVTGRSDAWLAVEVAVPG